LLVLLVIIIFVGIGFDNKKTSTVISNSYNDNSQTNYYSIAQKQTIPATKTVYVTKPTTQTNYVIKEPVHYTYSNNRVYYRNVNYGPYETTYYYEPYEIPEYYYKERYYNYRDYTSWGNHVKSTDFNYYCDSYEVHVKNYERVGDYFTVRFYFENGAGEVKTYDVRKYIFAGEEETFYFRDITKNKYDYYEWHYEVIQ